MRQKRNFVSWNRSSVALKRHLPIVLKPLTAAVVGALIWKLALYDQGISFAEHIENPILFIILPLVSFVYVIFAGIAIGSVFDEYKIVSKAVVKRDLDTFLLHRDEQLPILLHILIGIPSFLLVGLTMLFHYQDMYIGLTAVFSVILMVATAWIVATELDDFEKSIWFRESIPKEWHNIDVKTYFKQKRSQK
jgi:hypothetical protein